jgi:hypothetical protein
MLPERGTWSSAAMVAAGMARINANANANANRLLFFMQFSLVST